MGTLPQRTVRTLALGAIGAMLLGAASRTKADAILLRSYFKPNHNDERIDQHLGVASDFLIPNGTTSRVVALFDVVLGVVSAGSSFPVDVYCKT